MRARFGICQGVVMLRQVKAAGSGNCLKLMVREEMTKMSAGGCQRIKEDIVRIVHLIDSVNSLQTAFIEARIMSDQWIILQQWTNPLPDFREHRRIFSIFRSQTMHLATEPLVVFGLRMDEAVEGIHDDVITDDDYADTAHAARLLVRGLEIQAVV